MSIKKLEKRIKDKATEEAKLFLDNEKKKNLKELKKFKEIKNKESLRRIEKLIGDIKSEEKKKIDQEERKLERSLLEEKRILLEDVFLQVEDRISSLGKNLCLNLIKKLILRDAPLGESVLFVNKRDYGFINKKFIDDINEELGKSKRSIKLSTKVIDIKGGCILKGNEIEVDDSISSLVGELREKEEIDVAKKLFMESE
jgi:vacuolar-type H+-ATPase subunit E/Vma4